MNMLKLKREINDKRFIYTECCVFDKTKAIPATLEEVTKLIIKEGKC